MAKKKEDPSISIPQTPPLTCKLQEMVQHPDEIDAATSRLGIAPFLMNPHLATPVNLSAFGLGKAVHFPVQISRREGGRKSLYFLQPGEKVLAGVYVTGDGMALRYVSRETGRALPAEAGDGYVEEIRTREGQVVARLHGKLEVINAAKGEGRLVFVSSGGDPAATSVNVWVIWSCIYIQHEDD